jgi:putative membrane protein
MLWGAGMMVLFWGGLIALLVWGVQSLVKRDGARDPLEIAKERLARGEITLEQFEEIKSKLQS